MKLTGKQNRHLRGLGHHLRPIVQVGQGGMTDAILEATNRGLDDHELIKVKIGSEERQTVAGDLAARSHSALVQVLGRIVLLYRPHPERPAIKLPTSSDDS